MAQVCLTQNQKIWLLQKNKVGFGSGYIIRRSFCSNSSLVRQGEVFALPRRSDD